MADTSLIREKVKLLPESTQQQVLGVVAGRILSCQRGGLEFVYFQEDDLLREFPDLERDDVLACLEFSRHMLAARSQHLTLA